MSRMMTDAEARASRSTRADHALELADEIRQALETGRGTPLASAPRLSERQADELITEVRSARSRR